MYDEFLIAYKDRRAALDTTRRKRPAALDPFSAAVVVGGKVVARWRRVPRAEAVAVRITPLAVLARKDKAAIAEAAASYAAFVDRRLELSWD